METDWLNETRTSYDTVAAAYADFVRGSLEGAPMLRAGLRAFADLVGLGGGGRVLDAGCGPGQVTAHLRALGVDAFGVDLSAGMVDVARRAYPALDFVVGSVTALGLGDGSLGGVLAFWSLIHIPDDAIPGVLAEFRRVLRPGAPILIGFHAGEGSRRKTEGYGGRPMNVFVHRRSARRMTDWLTAAGFTVETQLLLGLDSAHPGAMVFGRRSAADVAHARAN